MHIPPHALDYRGIVLSPGDLNFDWVRAASHAGLNLIALHHVTDVLDFVQTAPGHDFSTRALAAGIEVEYELHAMHLLLPRERFGREPNWFRMDANGARTPDGNFCPSNSDALAMVCENAVRLANRLRPTTHRYFLWQDDGSPWCRCPKCRELTDPDQDLLVMNAIIAALRRVDSRAGLAYLAYHNTLGPPRQIEPSDGVFLEWAPIHRCYDHALDDPACEVNRTHRKALESLLDVFAASRGHVLEYWMDCSLFSRYKRPAVRLPFRPEIMEQDVACYASRGFRSITSFGVYLDREYAETYGEPPVDEYERILEEVRLA